MGVKHSDMVRTDFLQYSITKIKQRHVFLERLGRYQTPDKKGQTQIPNPLLKDILRVSEAEFLARTACSSTEEFEVFKKLFAREEEEGSKSHMPYSKSLSLDEDEDEDEEEEEVEEWREDGGWEWRAQQYQRVLWISQSFWEFCLDRVMLFFLLKLVFWWNTL